MSHELNDAIRQALAQRGVTTQERQHRAYLEIRRVLHERGRFSRAQDRQGWRPVYLYTATRTVFDLSRDREEFIGFISEMSGLKPTDRIIQLSFAWIYNETKWPAPTVNESTGFSCVDELAASGRPR